MEIELKKTDYEVKGDKVFSLWVRNLYLWILKKGNFPFILGFCLFGYLGIKWFLGDAGQLFWGALVTQTTHLDFFRPVTSIFLHGSFVHILVNILSLFALCKQLEYIWNRPQVFLLFFISALMANYIGFSWYNYFSERPLYIVGASGGLFGLLGALSAFFIFHKELSPNQKKAYLQQMLPILFLNLLLGLFIPNIGLVIHIFGFFSGLLLGFILQRIPFNLVKHRPLFWSMLFLLSILYIITCFVFATINFMHLTTNLPSY